MHLAGIAHRLLRQRMLVRAPIPLFRCGLGWLFAGRFLLLEHRGRRTGQLRYVVLEVLEHPDPRTYRVVAGLGSRSQWLQNVAADPQVRVSVRRRRRIPAIATILPPERTEEALTAYASAHPRAWRVLQPVLDRVVPPGDATCQAVPVVEIVLIDSASDAGRTTVT